jgi:predicted O-methyltransferase YrrM
MRKKLRILKKYFQFYLKAGNAYSIHSPFVYSLYTEVLRPVSFVLDQKLFLAENLLHQLYVNKKSFSATDTGEQSRTGRALTVGKKAKSVSQNSKGGRILYRLVKKFQPEVIVELGTGAGASSLYMSCASPSAQICTIEGNTSMAVIAKELFQQYGNENIHFFEGLFDDVLPTVFEKTPHIDIAFIDGDHKGESLLRYYEMLLPFMKDNSIIVLHDIYWSDDMNETWKKLISRPEVHVSVDIFHFGLLFFNKAQPKQHFQLKV